MKSLIALASLLLSPVWGVLLSGEAFALATDKNIRLADLSNAEINCVVLREIMEALPAYVPIKKGIKDYFKKGAEHKMKSFREIAMRVFGKIDYENEPERLELAQQIEALRSLKGEYSEKFGRDVDLDFEEESAHQENLTVQMDALNAQIKAKKKEIFEDKKTHMKTFALVAGFVNKSLAETGQDSLKNRIARYQFFQEHLNLASIFFHDPEETARFKKFVQEEFKNSKDMNGHIDNLLVKSREQRTLKGLMEGLNFYGELALFREIASGDFSKIQFLEESEVKTDHKVIEGFLKSVRKTIKSSIKAIQAGIRNEMKKIKKSFQKQKEYQKYIKNIKFLRSVRESRRQKLEELEELQEMHEKLAAREGNLNMSGDMSFTIASDVAENLQQKINLLESKAKVFTTAPVNDYSDEFKGKMLTLMEKYKIRYHQLKALSEQKLERMREKLELGQRIDALEAFFDAKLGGVFARVQEMADGRRCFTKSQLSYIFFAMVKTNVVIDEKAFLGGFLTQVPYIAAKDFIVFNYEIFAHENFILAQINRDDFKEALDEYRAAEQRAVIETYVNNWSFLVNSYKDYTDFGTSSEKGKVKKVGMGHRLSRILGISAQRIFNLSKDSGYNEYFAVFAGELLKMIPFLGNVPFLTSILATVLAYLCEFIIELIFKFFREAAPVVQSFMLQVAPVFGVVVNKEIYDLDYTQYVDFGEDVHEDEEDQNAKITVNIFDIEKEYLACVEDADSAENNGDSLYLFDEDTHVIELGKLGIPEVQTGLDELVQAGELSPDGVAKFESYKAQQESIRQQKEQIHQQHADQSKPVDTQGGGGNGRKRLLSV